MIYREAGQFRTSYAADQALFPIRQDRVFVWALLLLAFVVVPFAASEYLLRAILIPFLILAIGRGRAQPAGRLLRPDLARQRRVHGGRRLCLVRHLALHFPWLNLVVVFVLGGLFAAGAGVLFGLPSLRIKGYYLAVATLAAQFFFDWLFIRVPWFTGYASSGSVSAPPLVVFGLHFDSPAGSYLLCLALLCVIALAAKNIVRGRIGRMWMAIRDMDIAAEIIGISPLRAKLSAFAISSFIVGVAGALWAFVHLGSWEPLAFSIERSFELLFMIVIGGLGSIARGLSRRRVHHDAADLPQPAADRPRHPAVDRDDLAPRTDDLRGADRLLPDRRAARARASLGDPAREAAAVAVPALMGPC